MQRPARMAGITMCEHQQIQTVYAPRMQLTDKAMAQIGRAGINNRCAWAPDKGYGLAPARM